MAYMVTDAVKLGHLLAATDLSSSQYYLINVDANGKAAIPSAGGRVCGVLQNKPEAGRVAEMQIGGVAKVVAGDATTRGASLSSDSSGRAIDSTAGTFAFGIGLAAAAAAGDIIPVLLQPGIAENLEAHALAGASHTATGLTTGDVLVATGATTFEWDALEHAELDAVGATDHHDNSNDPTADEKAALAGSSGTPSASNAFVTEEDSARKRDTFVMNVVGAISATTEVGGIWEAPAAGNVIRVCAYRKSTAGSSGSTIIDVNSGGSTLFTTQANRPEIAFDDSDGKAVQTTIENDAFVQGDIFTVDVDQIDTGGSPSDLTVIVTVEYSA